MRRHVIRVLLTVVCLIMLTATAFAVGEIDNPRHLRLNTSLRLDILEDESVWLSYTPTKTGTYHFVSDMDGDPACYLYEEDPESEPIDEVEDTEIDDYDYDCNFDLTCTLKKGVTYYFEVYANEDSQGTVKLTMDPFYAMAVGETEREVEYEAQVTLEVEAGTSPGNEISYLWTDADGEPLEGNNTGKQYVIESFTSPETVYYCEISDGTYSDSVRFCVWFDNHLQAKAEKNILLVYDDRPVVLKAIGSCDYGALSYQWSYADRFEYEYDEDEEEETEIPVKEDLAETGSELTVTAADVPSQSIRTYYCDISDAYGHSETIIFKVRSDNALTVGIKGGSAPNVPLHGEAVLEVKVSVSRGSFTCEWSRVDEEGNEFPIQGETTEKLVLSDVTERNKYVFTARDEYGNKASASFDVGVDNKLTAKPVGSPNRSVLFGGKVTLKVQASCQNGECYIVWSERFRNDDSVDDSVDNLVIEDIEEGPSVTLYNVEESHDIFCTVWDDYGNSVKVQYYVNVNSFLQASTSTNITVKYGATAKLGVKISADSDIDPDYVEYIWKYQNEYGEWDYMEDDGLSTLTTHKLKTTTLFSCTAYAYDEYEDEEIVYFLVQVKDPVYSDYSHNMKMLVTSFAGSSNPTEGKYFFNVDESDTVSTNDVFRYIVIENRSKMLKTLRGKPEWSIVPLSGTVPLFIGEVPYSSSNIAYQLRVESEPKYEETAKYLVRCIWDTEMWQKEFTIHFTNLKNNLPEGIDYLGAGDLWTETVGQPFVLEERIGFRNQWAPAFGETVNANYRSENVNNPIFEAMDSKMVSGVSKNVLKMPGIYNFNAVITVGNIEIQEPVTLYSLRKDGTLSDGAALKLPSALKKIEENTFESTKEEIVIIPDGCTEIGPRAFAASENLKHVVLPASVTSIDPTAFDQCGKLFAVVPADASSDALAETAEALGMTVLRQ